MTENICAPSHRRSTWLKLFVVLLPLFVTSKILTQWTSVMTAEAMGASSGGMWKLVLFAGFSFLISWIVPLVSAMLVFGAWGLLRQSKLESLSDVLKEQLRAYGSVMLWLLAFILPGIWKMLEYSFVSIVVFVDPAYARGEKDALQESKRLFYKKLPQVIGYVLLTAVAWPLLMTNFDAYSSFSDYPVLALGLSAIDLITFVLFQWLLFKLWRKAHGPDVQMAGH